MRQARFSQKKLRRKKSPGEPWLLSDYFRLSIFERWPKAPACGVRLGGLFEDAVENVAASFAF